METSKPDSLKMNAPLSLALLRHYDEFAQFHEDCAFFCDALIGLVNHHEILDPNTIHGLEHYTHWLKSRAQQLKDDLKQIRELGEGGDM